MKILDLTAPERSDIRFKRFTFPDGQPHFELLEPEQFRELTSVEIITSIKSPADIVDLALAQDSLLSAAPVDMKVGVNIGYMPGRMDRRIGPGQPFTLERLAALLNVAAFGAEVVRVLDPHSAHTQRLVHRCEPIFPDRLVKLALEHFGAPASVVIPDQGALWRTKGILDRLGWTGPLARCVKKRDPQTGKLSGFALEEGDVAGKDCLIVDDLCDGGGTFAGIAEVLRAAGAKRVSLCVTHGIFSKGFRIPGIDCTYCADSYGISDAVEHVAERGVFAQPHFTSYRRQGTVPPVLLVLTDFVRDHVRGLEAPRSDT